MKLSQDLYDSGVLRRQRTGPSDEWAFDEPGVSLTRVVGAAWTRLRGRLFSASGRSAGRGRAGAVRQQGGWQVR